LNLSASIVGASAAIMGILVAVTTYQPLMNVRLLLIGILNWHITAVILLDLMQFRFDNTGHISHLAGAFLVFFLFNYCKGN
jgi:membrane associated rhomboid family serine protease